MSPKKPALMIATRNRHKTREFAEMLGREFEVTDLVGSSLPIVKEIGTTFAENAMLKAVQTSRLMNGYVVADDSGLEVDALDGAPGVYSARFAGVRATHAENIEKLLAALARCQPERRSARFRCVLVFARRGEILGTFKGVVEGLITDEPRGKDGFGYDPIFQPTGFNQTFGELSPVIKNEISHRARAMKSLRTALLGKLPAG
ncbi:MAG: RdgB/HAM1 family non-canonical purine NTP pyrophosphatase [Chthoniobacterales bacterium]